MKILFLSIFIFGCIFTLNCQEKKVSLSDNPSRIIEFETPKQVKIIDYDGILMEPFLSRDGTILLFNNSNNPQENTDLYWATKLDDFTFQFKGEIEGVNTKHLEGVPTLDKFNNLYFVSNRNYGETFSTIFQARLVDGKAENIKLVEGISKIKPLWVNFDVEISATGETLYVVDSEFSLKIVPKTGDIFMAKKNGDKFEKVNNSNKIFKHINTNDIEYAVGISTDELEIYFTRLKPPITEKSVPEIFYATRKDTESSFDSPRKLPHIQGFAEAVTISNDGKIIYFHQKVDDKPTLFGMKKVEL